MIGDDRVALRNHLKEYRSGLGLNQTELGKLAGVSRQTISLIERGDYLPERIQFLYNYQQNRSYSVAGNHAGTIDI